MTSPILPSLAPGCLYGTKCPFRSERRRPEETDPSRRPPPPTYRLRSVPLRRTPAAASRASPLNPPNRERKEKPAWVRVAIKLSSRNNRLRGIPRRNRVCVVSIAVSRRLRRRVKLRTESSAPDPRYPRALHGGIILTSAAQTALPGR